MPSQVQLDHYYNSDMKTFENDFFNDSFEQRIPIFNYRIQRIGDYLPQGRLLDVGSAIGIFVEAMMRSNSDLRLECCEPSRDASQRLSQRYPSVPLHECWLQDLEAKEQYDAISLWDTLEHVVEIETFGLTIRQLLKPGGFWFSQHRTLIASSGRLLAGNMCSYFRRVMSTYSTKTIFSCIWSDWVLTGCLSKHLTVASMSAMYKRLSAATQKSTPTSAAF